MFLLDRYRYWLNSDARCQKLSFWWFIIHLELYRLFLAQLIVFRINIWLSNKEVWSDLSVRWSKIFTGTCCRVYTKKPGMPPDFDDGIILRNGVNVTHVCHAIHRYFLHIWTQMLRNLFYCGKGMRKLNKSRIDLIIASVKIRWKPVKKFLKNEFFSTLTY